MLIERYTRGTHRDIVFVGNSCVYAVVPDYALRISEDPETLLLRAAAWCVWLCMPGHE